MAKKQESNEENKPKVKKKIKTDLNKTIKENQMGTKKSEKKVIKKDEYKYPINSFIEDSVNVRKRIGGGESFKAWYKLIKKKSFHDKKTMKDWEILFDKFLKEPTI
jgi:hypothetical protein